MVCSLTFWLPNACILTPAGLHGKNVPKFDGYSAGHTNRHGLLGVGGEGGGGGGGRTHLLLASVISPLTTHPFRDGAPLLLLMETSPTVGGSLRFFHISHRR